MNFTNRIAEDYVASAVLNEPEKIVNELKAEGITIDYFHNHMPAMIWRLAEKYIKDNRTHEIELLEFSDEIVGLPNGHELSATISKIRCEWVGREVLKQHLATLKNMYAIRYAYSNLTETRAAVEEGISPEEIGEKTKAIAEKIYGILEHEQHYKTAKQGAEEFTEFLRTVHTNKENYGTQSGIAPIDQVTGGLNRNELWVIGGETSGGKTVLMFQIMANFLNLGKQVLLFSLETEASRIHSRLAANTESIEMSKILATSDQPLIKSEARRIKSYVEDVIESDCLTISDSDNINLESIVAKAQQLHDMGKAVDLIVVDYIQLVSLANAQQKSRQEQVAEVTRTLKQLAKKYQCPVLTATQLNDDGKARESRAIGHDADVYLKIISVDANSKDQPSVYVAKNRNGERDVFLKLKLNGAYQRFEEYYM